MNKYQRALKVLSASEQQAWKEGYDVYDLQEAKDLLKELVDKATPKKPITGEDQDVRYASIYECPNCHKMFLGTGTNYCYRCGQALKWDEEEV